MDAKTAAKLGLSLALVVAGGVVLVADSQPLHQSECEGVAYDGEFDYELSCSGEPGDLSYESVAEVSVPVDVTDRSIESNHDDLSFELRSVSDFDPECVDRDGLRHYTGFLTIAHIEDSESEVSAELECDRIYTQHDSSSDPVGGVGEVQVVDCEPVEDTQGESADLTCELTMTELD